MDIKPLKLKVGRDSVVMGNVTGEVGDSSVVIGPTDEHGNTIIDKPMAVGRGASAGPDSIAIGATAYAGADPQLPHLVNQLSDAVEATGDNETAAKFNSLVKELSGKNGDPDKGRALTILEQLRNAATLNGALGLIGRIQQLVTNFL